MIDPATDNLIALVRLLQSKLTNEQRLAIWKALSEGYDKETGKLIYERRPDKDPVS